MTFSIAARQPATGQFGIAITTSNLAVGRRCSRIAHDQGAFLSQHRTDTRLAEKGLALISAGCSASEAVAQVVEEAEAVDIGWRQLAAIDKDGQTAVHHGDRIYSIHTHTAGIDYIAVGNILANERVTDAMADAFEECPDPVLGEKLISALQAGQAAGGEILGPLRSAAVHVSGEDGLDDCDLRIDVASDAVSELRELWDEYRGGIEYMRGLAQRPEDYPVARDLFDASVGRIAELGLGKKWPSGENREKWKIV